MFNVQCAEVLLPLSHAFQQIQGNKYRVGIVNSKEAISFFFRYTPTRYKRFFSIIYNSNVLLLKKEEFWQYVTKLKQERV